MGTVIKEGPAETSRHPRRPLMRGIQIAVSGAVVVAIFALIMPKIASYSAVWKTITNLTWLEMATLVAATIFNLVTYWWQMQSALPGLGFWQSAVNNQSSTTIANIVPGGGVVAVGVAYAMFYSWGFTGSEIALLMTTTLLIPAVIGLAILAGSIVLFVMALWKESFARAIGGGLGKAATRLRKPFHRPEVHWGAAAARFRKQTIKLVERRWAALTLTTVLSHLALWVVLLLALRHVGVSEREVSTIQVLAVFAFARLLSAAPITPGGLGVVELALIGGLYAAGKSTADVPLDLFRAQIAAAVLLFRTLTYGVQIPLGGLTSVIWQRNNSWRKSAPLSATER